MNCMISAAKLRITKQGCCYSYYSVCDPKLSINRFNRVNLPISLIPQSYSQTPTTRLLPLNKQNSTCFQCRCEKTPTPTPDGSESNDDSRIKFNAAWVFLIIRNLSFLVLKYFLIYLADIRQTLHAFTYFFRSKKKKPNNLSLDKLPGLEAPLTRFFCMINYLQGERDPRDPDGIVFPSYGVLVCGPYGAGKTTLVHLVAQKAGVSFFPVSALDIARTKDDRFITDLFGEARGCSPSIIFIDDLHYIASSSKHDHHLSRLCYEMDVCEYDRSVVLVIAATIKRENLDPTLLNGWFLAKVYVDYPDEDCRRKFFALNFKGVLREEDKEAICNLAASRTSRLSWGILRHVVRDSKTKALSIRGDDYVRMDDVVKVIEEFWLVFGDVFKDEQEDTQRKTESMA